MKKVWLCALIGLTLCTLSACGQREAAFSPFVPQMLAGYPAGKTKTVSGGAGLEGFSPVAENGSLRLYYNESTAETAVEDIQSGTLFRSNPEGFAAGPQGSQLLITLYNSQGVQFNWDSCAQSVAYGQYSAEAIPNGLEVTYAFGKTEAVYAVPAAVKTETFEQEIMPLLEGTSGKTFVKLLYSKVSLAAIESPQQKQTLLERFPALAQMDLYVLKNNASKLEMQKAEKALTDVGYTFEKKQADEAAAGYTAQAAEQIHAQIKLRYTLTGTGLAVTVPAGEIAVSGGARITDLTVLPYLGSPGSGQKGFALAPDGMGALIDFSTIRDDRYPAYEARVYGRDYARLETDSASYGSRVYLPVFGVHQGTGAVTGVIESGAGLASIVADAPRASGSLGHCAPKFLLLESTYYSLDAKPENRVMVFQNKANQEDLTIAYRFLPGAETTYSQMAAAIREELIRAGQLPEKLLQQEQSLPLVLKAVGAIDVTELVLGIPANRVKPLSTYDQIADMAAKLQEASGASPWLIVAGGGTGGLRATRQSAFKPEGRLGGKAGFENLQEQMQALNIPMALDLNGQYVFRDKWLDGFNANADTTRLLTSAIAYKPDYTLSTMYQDTQGLSAYMMNLNAIQKTVAGYVQSAKGQKIDSFALSSLARDLYSDQNKNAFVSREEMKKAIAALIGKEAGEGALFLSAGANSYLLPSLALAYDLPMEASPYPLFSQAVPLLQMVLSGHVAYAATDAQYALDPEEYFLRMAETGSGLYMQSFAAPGDAVKYTDFDGLYASSFPASYETAAKLYRKASMILGNVYGREIVSHERRGEITRTGYSGGAAVYVNFGGADETVAWGGEAFLVPARDALYREEAVK